MNKWSKLIWSSGHSDKTKTSQKLNRQNISLVKNSRIYGINQHHKV